MANWWLAAFLSRFFFFSSRRRHTRCLSDWSSDVCSSDLGLGAHLQAPDLFSGNLHRSGTIPRDLLSGGELGGAGANHGARQRRSDTSAESLDQRGAGASTPSPVS